MHTLHKKGHSFRSIAKILDLDRRTVTKRIKEKDLLPYRKVERKSKLDPFKPYIKDRLKEAYPDRIPSTVILQEIVKQGYDGKIRILQDYIKSIWQGEYKKDDPVIRFETKPAYQAQVDWTPIRHGKDPIYAFVMVLGYSRMAFVYFTDNMKQPTWQDCHIKAFEYFGGTTSTILYDNLKSVVIGRDYYGKGKHKLNREFLEFSRDNFVSKLCKPLRPKTKGKVERFNDYLKKNFYIPFRASLKSSGIKIDASLLNSNIFSWLEFANNRVHYTTKEKPSVRFLKEKDLLVPFYKSIKEDSSKSDGVGSNSFSSLLSKELGNSSKTLQSDSSQKELANSPILSEKKSSRELDTNIEYYTTISDYERLLYASC